MASASSSKLLFLRRLSRALKLSSSSSSSSLSVRPYVFLLEASRPSDLAKINLRSFLSVASRSFCSRTLDLEDDSQGPAAIDYSSLLQEDEFHKVADSTIQDLQEKFENQVLTLKLGTLGTYVLNKQTPNRQIWLSSPVSGPSRFDWDQSAQAWVYRRTKANLSKLLETELEKLCGTPISLS
eukprot:XP_019078821.1 PREDICTED: frataxin, mitochondrial isoform X2 [Vitis vinifera]